MSRLEEEKFHARYRTGNIDDCWEWTGRHTETGYGHLWFSGRTWRAHRIAYVLSKGEIPDGMLVLHNCHNRACVNPEHLRLGTHQDNMDDRNNAGRTAELKGEDNGNSKLSEESVVEIRSRYARRRVTYQELAREYGVGTTCIGQIIRRERWVHI